MFLVLCQLLSAETWKGNSARGIVFKTFVLKQFSWIIEGPLNLFPNKTELGVGVTVCPSSSIMHSVWIYSPFQEPRSRTCSEDCGAVTGPDQGTRPRSQVSPDWPRHAAILTSDWLAGAGQVPGPYVPLTPCPARPPRLPGAEAMKKSMSTPSLHSLLGLATSWDAARWPPLHSVQLKLITFGTK